MVATRRSTSHTSYMSLIPLAPSDDDVAPCSSTSHSDSDFKETIMDTADPKQKTARTTRSRVPLWKNVLRWRYDSTADCRLSTTWEYWARDKSNKKYKLTDSCNPDDHHVVDSRVRMFWSDQGSVTRHWDAEDTRLLLTVTVYNDIKKSPSILIQGCSTPVWTYNEFVHLIDLVSDLSRGQDITSSCTNLLALPDNGPLYSELTDEEAETDPLCTTTPTCSLPTAPPHPPATPSADSNPTCTPDSDQVKPRPLEPSQPSHSQQSMTICQEVLDLVSTNMSPRAKPKCLPSSPVHKTNSHHLSGHPPTPQPNQTQPGTLSQSAHMETMTESQRAVISTVPADTFNINFLLQTSLVLMANTLKKAQDEIQELKSEITTAKASLPSDLKLMRLQICNEQKAADMRVSEKLSELQAQIQELSKENRMKDVKLKKLEDKITGLSHELKTRTALKPKNQSSKSTQASTHSHQQSNIQVPASSQSEYIRKPDQDTSHAHNPLQYTRTLLIGDSNLRHVNARRLDPKGLTTIRTRPGITIGRLTEELKSGRIDDKYKHVILHVGTNDVGNLHSSHEIIKDTKNLIGTCRSKFKGASISMTQILPYPQEDVTTANQEIKQVCDKLDVKWIELPIQHSLAFFQRDGIHLNRRGVGSFVRAIRPHDHRSKNVSNIETLITQRNVSSTDHVQLYDEHNLGLQTIHESPMSANVKSNSINIQPDFKAHEQPQHESPPSHSPRHAQSAISHFHPTPLSLDHTHSSLQPGQIPPHFHTHPSQFLSDLASQKFQYLPHPPPFNHLMYTPQHPYLPYSIHLNRSFMHNMPTLQNLYTSP